MLRLTQEPQAERYRFKLSFLRTDKKKGGNMTTKEKRRHARARYRVDVPIRFLTQSQLYDGSMKNISKGGAFIETNRTFSTGQDISFYFGKQNMIGIIVRDEPDGIRVKFKKTII